MLEVLLQDVGSVQSTIDSLIYGVATVSKMCGRMDTHVVHGPGGPGGAKEGLRGLAWLHREA